MKRRKSTQVGALGLAILLMCSASVTASAELKAVDSTESQIVSSELNSDETLINELLGDYFDTRYSMLQSLTFNTGLSDYFANKNDIELKVLETMIKHRKLQITDLTFDDFEYNLEFKNLEVENNSAIVVVEESNKIRYNCSSDIVSEEITPHNMELVKIDSSWYIKSDSYENEFLDLFKNYKNELERSTMSSIQSKILADSKEEVEERKKDLENLKLNPNIDIDVDDNTMDIEDPRSVSFTYSAYNREAAKNYALSYVMSPNSSYVNFESMGGNCTNFTSQCLKAGGIVDDKTGNYQWYYTSSSDRAPAWTSANYFRNYYLNNVGSASIKGLNAAKSTFSNMRLADMVQLVSGGTASHSMIITGYLCDNWGISNPWVNKYDVLISQNSVSSAGRMKNVPLSTKTSSKEYVKINGSYK